MLVVVSKRTASFHSEGHALKEQTSRALVPAKSASVQETWG